MNDGLDADALAERKMQFLYALRSKGVTDKQVLSAMETVDRGPFIRGLFAERAYEDMPLPIACGQTISQPSVVGLMTQALELTPRDKVLEIGTGSGYQAAILSKLARRVYTIDRHRRLVHEARVVFDALDLNNITAITGDGSHGLPEQAPFDRIIVTAAAEDPPARFLPNSRKVALWCCLWVNQMPCNTSFACGKPPMASSMTKCAQFALFRFSKGWEKIHNLL